MAKLQNAGNMYSNRSVVNLTDSIEPSGAEQARKNHRDIRNIHRLILEQRSCKTIHQYIERHKPNLSKDRSLLKAATEYTKNSRLDSLCQRHSTLFGYHRRVWVKRQKLINLLIKYGAKPSVYHNQLIQRINRNASKHEQETPAYQETINILSPQH